MARFVVGLSLSPVLAFSAAFAPNSTKWAWKSATTAAHKALGALFMALAFAAPAITQTIPQGITQGSTQITAGPVNIDMATGNMVMIIPLRKKTGAFPFAFD